MNHLCEYIKYGQKIRSVQKFRSLWPVGILTELFQKWGELFSGRGKSFNSHVSRKADQLKVEQAWQYMANLEQWRKQL